LASDADTQYDIQENRRYKTFARYRPLRLPTSIDDILKAISQKTHISVSELIRQYVYESLMNRKDAFPPELKLKLQRIKFEKEKDVVKDIRFFAHQKRQAWRCLNDPFLEPFLTGDALQIVKKKEQTMMNIAEDCNPIYAEMLEDMKNKEKSKHATKKQAETQTQA
jgi:hypothetical protein